MKHLISLVFPLLALCAQAAPVPSDDAKVGTLIDTGIIVSGLGLKQLPLPAGQWRVVARVDYTLGLSSRRIDTGITGTPMVSLTILNEDKSAPVAVAVVDYPTNAVVVRWSNAPCQDAKSAATEDFGTNNGSLKYACARIYSHAAHDFKRFVSAPTLPQEVKDRWGPLAQFTDSLPAGYDLANVDTNLDRGRKVTMTLITRAVPGAKQGEVPPATLAYTKTVGKALMNWLSNDDATIGGYPAQ